MKRVNSLDAVRNKRLDKQNQSELRMELRSGFALLLLLLTPLLCVPGCEPKKPTPPVPLADPRITPTPLDTGRRKDAGHLSADRLFHDFGRVDKSQKLVTSFELTNNGKETLKIGEIIPTCKCVLAPLKTKVLESGQSVTLQVTLFAPTQPGPTYQSVKIHVEKPSLPRMLSVRLAADVKRYITIEPPHFEIKLSRKKQPDIALKVSSTDEKPFRILGYQTRDKAIQLIFDKSKAASIHTIPIQVDRPKLNTARERGLISLQLNHPKSQSISFSYALILPYVAHPSARLFLNPQPGKKVRDYLQIVSNFQEPFELGEISSEHGLVQVKNIEKIPNGFGYKLLLEMQMPRDLKKQRPRDFLNIKIKDDPKRSLKILCYVIP